jgi:hypothetical protein
MADITNKNIDVPGVNSATNFIKQYAFEVDFNTMSEIAEAGTHKLKRLPPGEAVVGLKVVVIEKAASGGAATAQFKVNENAVNTTALALAALADGFTHNFNVSGIAAYGTNTIQLTVGTAAFTGGKLLVVAETLPAELFVTAG